MCQWIRFESLPNMLSHLYDNFCFLREFPTWQFHNYLYWEEVLVITYRNRIVHKKYPKPTPFFLFKNNVLTSESLEVPPTSDKGPVSGPSSFPFPFSGFFWSFPVSGISAFPFSGISAFPFSGISAFPFSGISSTPVSFSGSIVSGFTSGLSSVYFFSSKQFRGKGQKTHRWGYFYFVKKSNKLQVNKHIPITNIDTM